MQIKQKSMLKIVISSFVSKVEAEFILYGNLS